MKRFRISGLLISVAIAELVGVLTAFFTRDSNALYQQLTLPPLSPPGWLFPVVWTILYALMGIAAYLVYVRAKDSGQRNSALIFYGIQLALNFLWSIVFFTLQMYWLAVAVLILLIILLLVTIWKFYQISKPAAVLLLPYLLWTLFAACLNIAIAVLN